MCIWGCIRSVEVFDGVQSVILYKTLDGFIPAPTLTPERAQTEPQRAEKASA